MRVLTSFLAMTITMASMTSHAHHSTAARFNLDETASVEGVVKEFWFANPHSRLYLEVTTDSGDVQEWMIEGNSRNNLIRRGWSEETLQPGMTVSVTGHPSRDGSNSMEWGLVTTEQGEELER